MKTLEERFWTKVVRRGVYDCWLWSGSKNAHGYGKIGLGGRGLGWGYAHRVSYELANGPIPDGLHICHRCDVPSCVNPSHLFAGTAADNLADMHSKGRARGNRPVGASNPKAKLGESEVLLIRERLSKGEGRSSIAAAFGITPAHVSEIGSRKRWGHLK